MTENYKPEFLSKSQRRFVRRHKKSIKLAAIALTIVVIFLIIWPFIYDFGDMKIKERAIHGIAQNLNEDMPNDWQESQRCVERRQKMEILPPVCYVDVSSSFIVSGESDVRKIIDYVYTSIGGSQDIILEPLDDSSAYPDLSLGIYDTLSLSSYEQSSRSSSGRSFEVRWAPDKGGCRISFMLERQEANEDRVELNVRTGCSKTTKFTYYQMARY